MKTTLVAIVIPYGFDAENQLNLWMQKREGKDELQGFYEFPGGKLEQGESPVEAAIREVSEEVSVSIDGEKLKFFKIHLNDNGPKIINLYIYLYHDKGMKKFSQLGWKKCNNLESLIDLDESLIPENKIFLKELIEFNDFNDLNKD